MKIIIISQANWWLGYFTYVVLTSAPSIFLYPPKNFLTAGAYDEAWTIVSVEQIFLLIDIAYKNKNVFLTY